MLAVCLAFYSPCDYVLPRQHLAATLEWLSGEGVPVVLAQVVRPGQSPQPVPTGITSLVYESEDYLFFKESLWNLAAAAVPAADKLLFLDTDLSFSVRDILEQADALLDRVDICQPFGTAVWPDRDGKIVLARRSAAFALSRDYEPSSRYYHPGFAWGMTRRAFEFLGGLYDRHVVGGGDIALAYSLHPRFAHVDLRAKTPNDAFFAEMPSYLTYRHRAASLCLRIGSLENVDCRHKWHGDVVNRQYTQRGSYLDHLGLKYGDEWPLRYRSDGLLEWADKAASEGVRRYFASRREDG